ncbi:MAG: glycosyltransferase family 2 protein [Deltaproteobacteria bacterium]|nr:glycosyltransferase family 2 protein [Deltaproteobacteria bacterium]
MTVLEKGLITIPAFNEAETIGDVVRGILGENLGCDIVVVDDGSSDKTAQVLGSLPVIVLSHPVNLGYGAAVQTGMMYAVRNGYDFLVLMDADGQHISSQVGLLLEELRRGNDIVIGSRLSGDSGSYRIPFLRMAGIRFFSFLAWVLGGVRIRDVTSGFQAMRREVFTVLSREYPVDFPDAEVVVMLGLRKFKVAEVPVAVRERQGGESMYSKFGTVLYYPFKSVLSSFIVLLRMLREK